MTCRMPFSSPAGTRSALTIRLSHYLPLTASEAAAIEAAQGPRRKLIAGEALLDAGGPVDSLFVVQQGWLHSSVRPPVGGRQILSFHYPGDLVDNSSIAWARAPTTLTAVSDCIVSDISKKQLGALLAQHGRIAGLLYAVAAAEAMAMADRLTSIGRMNAIQRLATLILDMLARLRVTAGGVVDSFDLPLTQTDLGDALGLTKVHVNRTMREMEERGMIARNGRRIRICDEAALVGFTGFVDRHATIATDWLPPPR
ncbi:Crp/Fnr family transcriptional regulator [Sphingomonas metalli]|uniref:Crp/Fnr family transcriptional regulator n=1 Tax=Sphingomonas metalli TaxID=1779358 RepID=A0A916T0T6_9SPHN|nr:Crp/Fnr family transcriptional regulator [Sphingomonas metalli]GGB25378.1 Crp/Fnr family transcriptional regulator [Sphingomonas metalli]